MTGRFAVPLSQLEAQSRVQVAEQAELQPEPRRPAPLLDSLPLHPFGDGACADGDGD